MKITRFQKPDIQYSDIPALSTVDKIYKAVHYHLFIRHPVLTVLGNVLFYTFVILVFGTTLGVSSNYVVLLPVLVISITFGFKLAILAGALGLPINIFLFYCIGHPEYTPENIYIAEAFGIIVGATFGYLSDYFYYLMVEITNRKKIEADLRTSLDQNSLLLTELQHRVKNNLNVIKSLIQLQANRTDNEDFKDMAASTIKRIMSIALVYERLYIQNKKQKVDALEYFQSLVKSAESGSPFANDDLISLKIDAEAIPVETASLIGIILNELIMNSIKYAFDKVEKPEIHIFAQYHAASFFIEYKDNGQGFVMNEKERGLGTKIIEALTSQLHATYTLEAQSGMLFTMKSR